jgi:hypothetical protein
MRSGSGYSLGLGSLSILSSIGCVYTPCDAIQYESFRFAMNFCASSIEGLDGSTALQYFAESSEGSYRICGASARSRFDNNQTKKSDVLLVAVLHQVATTTTKQFN